LIECNSRQLATIFPLKAPSALPACFFKKKLFLLRLQLLIFLTTPVEIFSTKAFHYLKQILTFERIDMGEENKDVYGSMYDKDVTGTEQQEQFYQQTVKELKTEQRFIDYFSSYHPDSTESFIRHYAQMKTRWFAMADDYKRWKKLEEEQWMESAYIALEQIQQKKLFNLQCLWRADKTKAEGIVVSSDFEYWQHHILFCPAIEPIANDELDFYIQYLQQSDLDRPFDEWYDLQNYELVKENFEGRGDPYYYNPWYRFYDKECGTDSLLRLPDSRGEKEEFYLTLTRNEYVRTHQEEIKKRDEGYARQKPFLMSHEGTFREDFVKKNESADYYKLYKIYRHRHDRVEELEKVIYAGEMLEKIPLPYYPSEAADDWKAGVKKTFERYRREMTVELLPQVYEEYLQNCKNRKWLYPGRDEMRNSDDPWKSISAMRKKHIMEGRQLNDEPADLNF
jgi:hypothetical protein